MNASLDNFYFKIKINGFVSNFSPFHLMEPCILQELTFWSTNIFLPYPIIYVFNPFATMTFTVSHSHNQSSIIQVHTLPTCSKFQLPCILCVCLTLYERYVVNVKNVKYSTFYILFAHCTSKQCFFLSGRSLIPTKRPRILSQPRASHLISISLRILSTLFTCVLEMGNF